MSALDKLTEWANNIGRIYPHQRDRLLDLIQEARREREAATEPATERPRPTQRGGEQQGGEALAYLSTIEPNVSHVHALTPEGPQCMDLIPGGTLDMIRAAVELDGHYVDERIRAAEEAAWDAGASEGVLSPNPFESNPHRRTETDG